MGFASFMKSAWGDLVKIEHKVASALQTAAADVPEVESAIAKYGPEVASVANIVVPSTGKYTAIASESAVVLGQLVEAGGTAFEQKLADVGADQTFVADLKGLYANLKAAATAAGETAGAADPRIPPAPLPASAKLPNPSSIKS